MIVMSNISLQNLINERDLLEKKLADIEKKLTVVKLMLDAYSEGKSVDVNSPFKFQSALTKMKSIPKDDFPHNKKWIEKILHLIDRKDRFLSNNEIAEALLPYHPEYNIDGLKRKVSVNISAAYKNKSIDGLIKIRINKLPQGNVWGYEKWLNNEGKIKIKYRPYGLSESGQKYMF